MRIVNLTGHDVTLLDDNNKELAVFKPSGYVPRVIPSQKDHGWMVDDETGIDIDVVKNVSILDFDGLEIQPYVTYIVSWMFLRAMADNNHPNLHQFVAPNTKDMPKGLNEKPLGVRNFLAL